MNWKNNIKCVGGGVRGVLNLLFVIISTKPPMSYFESDCRVRLYQVLDRFKTRERKNGVACHARECHFHAFF
jgi:hypothetical protein